MVKGTFLMTQQFLQLNGKDSAGTTINITSAAALNTTPCLSSYSLSKLCQIQLQAFVRAENPNVRAVSLHPGILITRMTPPAFERFARDTFELVGGVAVWLATEQAAFMNGRYMSVNWSVDELVERKNEIVSDGLLEVALRGRFGYFE
jgi:NAD(P)-dependent dehydrogenase (short-subunit alcohol dehydrogenase family)